MPDLNETRVPGSKGGHYEARWTEGSVTVFVKRFDTRFECFWYTRNPLSKTIASIKRLSYDLDLSIRDPPQVVRAVGENLPEGEISSISLYEFESIYDYDNIDYFEVKLNSGNVYWARESPPEDIEADQPYIIHISGRLRDGEIVQSLYDDLGSEQISEDDRTDLANETANYIL